MESHQTAKITNITETRASARIAITRPVAALKKPAGLDSAKDRVSNHHGRITLSLCHKTDMPLPKQGVIKLAGVDAAQIAEKGRAPFSRRGVSTLSVVGVAIGCASTASSVDQTSLDAHVAIGDAASDRNGSAASDRNDTTSDQGLSVSHTLGPIRREPEAPRLIAPLSTAIVSTRRPTLRWERPRGQSSATVEICSDRECQRQELVMTTSETAVRPMIDLATGVHFWRIATTTGGVVQRSFAWQFRVLAGSGTVDSTLGNYADFNGDGYADLTLGMQGLVSVHFGGPQGFSPTGGVRISNPGPFSRFGQSIATNDLNGDGFSELIVGAPGVPIISELDQRKLPTGAVYVFRGGPDGLTGQPSAVIHPALRFLAFGYSTISLSDANNDGYGDLGTSSLTLNTSSGGHDGGRLHICFGGPDELSNVAYVNVAPPEGLQSPIQRSSFPETLTAGDFDGDGPIDVLVGIWGGLRPFVVLSSVAMTESPRAIFGGGASESDFGAISRSGRCDLDGDGASEFVFGYGRSIASRIGIGHFDGLSLDLNTVSLPVSGTGPIRTVPSCVADLNGDGMSDIVVAVGALDLEATTTLYFLPGGHPRTLIDTSRSSTLDIISAPFSGLGAISGQGDFDRDGLSDLVVSSYNDQETGHDIRIYRGSSGERFAPGQVFFWPSPRSFPPNIQF